jgi:hypothetical protein
MVTSSTLSMRWGRLWNERPEPSKERFHSRMAATKTAARPVEGRLWSER